MKLSLNVKKAPGTFLLAAWLGAALFVAPSPHAATVDDPVRLGVAGRASATPWIAASGDVVAVAWSAKSPSGEADVYVAVSRDGGAAFAAPVRVNDRDGDARLGGELPPRVAFGPARGGADPAITVVWNAKATGTDIRSARSTDGGRTFSAAERPSPRAAPGDRGWQALAVDDAGRAHVVWLDHGGLATRPTSSSDHHGDGADMAQYSSLIYAGPDGRPRALTPGVCYCCKTALAAGPGGALYAAWRHVYPGNIRDIAFTMSADGGRTFADPVRVSEDNWQLAGCPDDGPAMAVGPDGTVHLVWPTVIGGETPEGALFYSSTRDGRSFTPRQRIATRGGLRPQHPQVVADAGGGVVVAWDEVIAGVRRASARALRVGPAGEVVPGAVLPIGGADAASSYPVMAAANPGVIVTWTQGLFDVFAYPAPGGSQKR